MLLQKAAYFFEAEHGQKKRLGFDIERRTGANRRIVGAGAHLVFPDIAQAHQGDRLREECRSGLETISELAQRRNEHVVIKGIHFVEQQY